MRRYSLVLKFENLTELEKEKIEKAFSDYKEQLRMSELLTWGWECKYTEIINPKNLP